MMAMRKQHWRTLKHVRYFFPVRETMINKEEQGGRIGIQITKRRRLLRNWSLRISVLKDNFMSNERL